MDGVFFAGAFLGSLVLFTLVVLSRASETRDSFDALEGRARPIVGWTHHD